MNCYIWNHSSFYKSIFLKTGWFQTYPLLVSGLLVTASVNASLAVINWLATANKLLFVGLLAFY